MEPRAHEATLMARMAAGDTEAVGELYDRYGARLYTLALHICQDRGAAEEVVQDIFVTAWREAARYDEMRGSVGAWLFTLARNRAIDALRKGGRRPTVSWQPLDDVEAGGHDVAASVEDRIMAAQARRAMESLPRAYREPLYLAYFRGLTHRQIADMTGLPLGTVKTRLRTALEHLRRAMAPPGKGPKETLL